MTNRDGTYLTNNIPQFTKNIIKAKDEAEKDIKSGVDEKQRRLKAYRKEASRLVSLANKRLRRLEKAGLTDSPAYKKWLADGGQYFSVRGKDFNELQREVARMNKFINSQTSTIRGINKSLKDMAKNTGIEYKNLKELKQSASTFFELASKVEQYLRTVEDMASAIGYQKIWKAINQYTKEEKLNLSKGENDIEDMTRKVIDALDIYHEKGDFRGASGGAVISGWYQLE